MSLRGAERPPLLGARIAALRSWPHTSGLSQRWPLVLYLLWAAGLTIAYFTTPGRSTPLWAGLGLSSVLAILVGVRRNRPDQPLPWYLLAAALTTFAAGDLLYNVLTSVLHQDNPFPSYADVFNLAMYPLCATALYTFIRSRTPWADRSSMLDALIITVGLGLLSWIYLIEPSVRNGEITLVHKLVSVAYPLGDVLLLALLAGLLCAGGFRTRSLQMLTVASAGLLIADVTYGLIQLNGTWPIGGPVDGGWVLFYVLLGAAALDPSMAELTRPLPPKRADIGRIRLLLIAAASLVAPVDAIVQVLLGHDHADMLHPGASAVLFALVMTRIWGVVHGQQQGMARERTLRAAGAALVAASDEGLVAEAVRAALCQLTPGQSELGLGVALFEGNEFRSIESGVRAPMSSFEPETVGALKGFDPALVDAASVATLFPGPVPTGSTALVLPLRSGESLMGVVLVAGDPRRLVLMQDPIQALSFKVALSLQRIALAQQVRLRASEAHFRSLIQNASDVILVVGDDNLIAYQTPSVTRVLGYHASALAGRPIEHLLDPGDRARSMSMLDRMRRYGVHRDTKADWRLLCEDGRWIDAEVVCSNLLDDPDVKGLVLTIRDVTERRDMERELKHRAFHDSLTSLANRVLFVDRLQHALRRGARLSTLVAVMFLDVDEFKGINDTRGHAFGDMVLKRVAKILATSIRSGDSAARLGGDEFALLVEGASTPDELEALAGRIQKQLREPMELDGEKISVRVSIGIATSENSTDASELLKLADLALYETKASFKGGFRFFRDALRADLVDRTSRHEHLRLAINDEQFGLAYQPIVHLESLRIVGFEALVRWEDPVRGVIPPGDFIADAEESGLIVPLGEWVLRHAVEQAHAWQQAYPMDPPLRMSVNVSARQFREPGFAATVSDALARHPIIERTLVLELTESLLIEDDGVAEILTEIGAMGVLFALDDFGTGYSALGYLRHFPIHILKLDKSFVDDLETPSDHGPMIEAIIQVAKTLELGLVVEGIESAEQSQKLIALGCQLGQGFLYSRPEVAADIESRLIEQVLLAGAVTPASARRPLAEHRQ